MRKQTVINEIKSDSKELKDLVAGLSKYQLIEDKVTDLWTTKDIIAHLVAWNCEVVDEIDRVLENHASWPGKYENEEQESEFNKIQVEKRRDKAIDEILQEWENSQKKLGKINLEKHY